MKYSLTLPVLGAAVAALTMPLGAGTVAYDQAGGATGFQSSPAGPGWAPMLQKGTQELSIGGQLSFEDFDDLEYDLRLKYGWFVRDRWEIGITTDLVDFGSDKFLNLGLFTEYNFDTGTRWVPYIGIAAKWAEASTDNLDEDSVLFSGELGVKYFIRSHMAIYGAINFDWSPDDIFDVGDDIVDNSQNLLIGMRFYF